ncbi:hypothetical protein N0V82_002382 [Gnomoniopsis sp. IMI 355080]|nr:hypothetical protein N0V82_002382 [Gnomoniopsis sp. IMI 355080]
MAIVHDAPEAVAGDITPSDGVNKKERKQELESLGLAYLCCLARQNDNQLLAYRFKRLWDEFEEGRSPVAKVVNQVDLLEAMHQALQYTKRYPHLDFSDFKSHRDDIHDPWLALQADEVLRQWAAFDLRKKSSLIVIFVIGGPGVGKGTQCGRAAEHFGFDHISVGELLRIEGNDAESVFQEFIQDSFKKSIVVPASLAMRLLERRIRSAQEQGKVGVLVDGFPRGSEQLKAFEEQIPIRYATVIMDCAQEILCQRLSSRAGTSGRPDDQPDLIKRRVQTFYKDKDEVLKLLSNNYFKRCNGSIQEVEAVFQHALQDIINRYSG